MAVTSELEVESTLVRQSYADQVYHHIKNLILSGQLRQGDKIVEDKIAKRFGVSRTPIREALRRLQVYGLVHLQPRSYAEVVTIDSRQANDIAYLRLHLEGLAFRLLCRVQDPSSAIVALQNAAEAAQQALRRGSKADYFEADSVFHNAAADYSGNGELAGMYRSFESKVQLLRIVQDVPIERLEVYMMQHFDLIELVRNRRIDTAGELLRMHIIHDLSILGDGWVSEGGES